MRHCASLCALLLSLASCGPDSGVKPKRDPPQVTLTVASPIVAAQTLALSVDVSGCSEVKEVAILHNEEFLRTVDFTGHPTTFDLAAKELGTLYPRLGFAASLSLVAQATCDDDRTNTSVPTPVDFFPVERTVDPTTDLAAPDAFLAEGGKQGFDTSLIGCVGYKGATALAKLDTFGGLVSLNTVLPFPCSFNSNFSERNPVTGKRWLWERGVGAFAFDGNLTITSVHLGFISALAVGPDGDAIIWDSKAASSAIKRVSHLGQSPANIKWGAQQPAGIVLGNPVINSSLSQVVVPVFVDQLGKYNGVVAIERIDWATGASILPRYDIKQIDYAFLDVPTLPPALFNADGSIVIFPFQQGTAVNTGVSNIIACATNSNGCMGAAQKWISPNLEGVVTIAVPFANHTLIAGIAAQKLWFIDAATGAIANKGQKAIIPTGSNITVGYQEGKGRDFYVLNGAQGGYPTELVGVDDPVSGELFRFRLEGGTHPSNALTTGVDDAGQLFIRAGGRLLKPLPNAQYRQARGATPIPK